MSPFTLVQTSSRVLLFCSNEYKDHQSYLMTITPFTFLKAALIVRPLAITIRYLCITVIPYIWSSSQEDFTFHQLNAAN
jgi:hypothetical protein